MHATAPAPDIPPAVPFTNHQRLQDDALQTIHKVMLLLAQSLTGDKPKEEKDDEAEDPAQARTTTQRIRLCLQAAREILRFNPPADAASAPSPSPTPSRRVSPTPAPQRPQPATILLAAAGHGVSRFGERIYSPLTPGASSLAPTPDSPPTTPLSSSVPTVSSVVKTLTSQDSGLSTHNAPPSAPPRDSSLIAHNSASQDSGLSTHDSPTSAPTPAPSSVPSVSSVVKRPLPPKPQYFTKDETAQILDTMRSGNLLTPALYARIQEWNAYAIPADLSPAFGITLERLEARNPHNPANQRASPTQ